MIVKAKITFDFDVDLLIEAQNDFIELENALNSDFADDILLQLIKDRVSGIINTSDIDNIKFDLYYGDQVIKVEDYE